MRYAIRANLPKNIGQPFKKVTVLAAATLAAFNLFCISSMAQSVYVSAGPHGAGQGLMIRLENNCYVILPRHVSGPMRRVGLATADPVTKGIATILDPFWEGIDLTVGVVRRGIESRCTTSLSTLDGPGRAVTARAEGDLVRILSSGKLERVRMRITEVRYLDFEAEVLDQSKKIAKGTSGAFLFVDERPIGMAITSDGSTRATFMRIEEIAMNVERWLASRSAAFQRAATTPSAAQQPGGFAVRLIDAQTLAIDHRFGAENVLSDTGAYVFEPEGNVSLVFAVVGAEIQELSRVRMFSDPDQSTAVPRRVIIQVSSKAEGESGWRGFWSGEMGPDGQLDTGHRAETRTRRMRITITSAWAPGTVRLDRVSFE